MKSSPFRKGLTNLQGQSIEEGKETCFLWLSLSLKILSCRHWSRLILITGMMWRLLNWSRASFSIVGSKGLFSLKRASQSFYRYYLLDWGNWGRFSRSRGSLFNWGRSVSVDRWCLFSWSSRTLRASKGCLLNGGRSASRIWSWSLSIGLCRLNFSLRLLLLAIFLILMTAQRGLLG